MDTKDNQNPTTNLTTFPILEDSVVYIAVKGSLHAHDCSVFGLKENEVKALTKRYPDSGFVVNGTRLNTNALDALNSLAQIGYKIISSTGETEITWTLQRDI